MTEIQVAPYGSWKSPITADLIVAESIGLQAPCLDGDDVYWLESRPQEQGRSVLVRRTKEGQVTDMTPAPFNVRTRVHEYGGGAYAIADGIIYFSNFADQRLYRLSGEDLGKPLTPETDSSLRYADYVIDPQRNLLFGVREDHRGAGEAVNTLVKIACSGDDNGGEVIVSGNDFYAAPRLSPDGTQLSWLTWNHPNMPWDGTELWVGAVKEDGSLGKMELVAGGVSESIFQPQWSPDGVLYFVSDRSNWWNLYRWQAGQVTALYPLEAEFGLPYWNFGLSTYSFESDEHIICTYSQDGDSHLARLNTNSTKLETIPNTYTSIGSLQVLDGHLLFMGASPTETSAVILVDLATQRPQVLQRSSDITIDAGYISIPEAIEFPTENNVTAHAFYYPPTNRYHVAPVDERPPVRVLSHGGPTGATKATLSLNIQYWTSRGIGVVDVNYGGSTGYGRAYRQRLNEQWGVVDLDDCVNAAHYLVKRGNADPRRLAIAGGSAGGYTTLCALAFRDVFAAGASYFGVADLEGLAIHTHKFESRYLDSMIGPYPEQRARYIARSPIHHVDGFSCPIILFQGVEDRVVPQDQADKMYAAVKAKGLPVSYILYEGEQHGFRKAENIKRTLEAELYFYGRIFEFALPDEVDEVVIENLY